jgi:hypothetical protein
VLQGGDQAGVGETLRQLDRVDDVVAAVVSQHVGANGSALGVDDYVLRIDADLVEHGAHERGFVLTVAVAVGEGVGGGMGLQAADAQFDGDVADVVLNELGDGAHLVERGGAQRQ